ncbi:MAG: response regulator [Kofleriaceae bacterium]
MDPARPPRPLKVLFVDDDVGYLRAIQRLLRPGQVALATASDGERARRHVEAGGLELIVLDVYMPDLDGIAYCRALRQAPATEACAIVVVSAMMTSEIERAAREAGATLALDKAADLERLLAFIRTLRG